MCRSYNPGCVLEVVICSEHLSTANDKGGGKKDTLYIWNQILLHYMKRLDPKNELFHCLEFDRMSKVTKAAEMTQTHFLRCVVVHGVENGLLLIFGKVFKLHPCSNMKIVWNIVNNLVLCFCFVKFVSSIYDLDVLDATNFWIDSSCTRGNIQPRI